MISLATKRLPRLGVDDKVRVVLLQLRANKATDPVDNILNGIQVIHACVLDLAVSGL